MNEYALVLNAGSSSLKFSVFRKLPDGAWIVDTRGQIDGIGSAPRFWASTGADARLANEVVSGGTDRNASFDWLASWLKRRYRNAHVLGVGHRIVHGGARYTQPTIVTSDVLKDLRTLIPLAPLHQPYNLAAIEAVSERLPGVPQVACFDTSFHRTHLPVADVVPLPRSFSESGVQRYGFHGLSYEYIASVLPRVASDIAGKNVIVAHLGSGASLCAMRDRKSIDSTFGFTALDGLCMGTRPGSIDPGVVLYLFQGLHLSSTEVEALLYKKSGLLGISAISADMRVLLGNPDPDAQLAVDYFVYRAVKEIGALTAVLGGLDALVFTAGIGENSAEIRRRICKASEWLGIDLDDDANNHRGPRITRNRSRVSAWVIPTNEELMIARHTGALLGHEVRV